MFRQLIKNALFLIAATAVSAGASAQNTPKLPNHWPDRPLRILVGFPGGSSPDLVARALQAPLSKALGQPVIVENRPGVGTVGQIGMELLKGKTGIDPVHIPYQGNPQVISAMIGGQVNLALLPPGLATTQIRAGKLKAIGVTSATRSPLVPEIPSLADAGVKDYQLEIWTAAAAPARMPKAIVARLSTLISEIVRSPEMRQKLFVQGWDAVGSSPEGLENRIKSDTALLGAVIKARHIRVD